MKRSILLLIPLVLGLVSCGEQPSSSSSTSIPEVIPNQEDVDKLKSLLCKQDLSTFYTKCLQGMYRQDYDVLDISYDDEENTKTSNYLNYAGYGFFGFYYDLSEEQYNSIVDEKGDVDTFDAIATGSGSYGIVSSSRTMSFSREGSWESKINNLDILQSITLKTTKDDVWVDNSLFVSDDGIFRYESNQRLIASINKDLLFGSVSTRMFRELFSKVSLFDTPGNVEHLDKLYFSICRELTTKSDKEISDFLIANQISINEEEDNIELNFTYTNEDIEEEEADYIFPGAIKGTLLFDKETYQFSDFDYEMLYEIETYDEDTGNVKLINIRFTCSGLSSHELPDDPWEPHNPTVYEDVAEFLKDVNEQVVPPNIPV